ncbi:MAG: hypothetical protein ACXACK_18450 [Candidatus Hodarchaeales archaeon]
MINFHTEDIINSITLTTEKTAKDLLVVTDTPSKFYPVATRVIAENGLSITHLESQTDNIEAIFEYLT